MHTPQSVTAPSSGLSIRSLTKVFGQTRALSEVDFDVEAGSVVGLLGHNGSGKSTLFKILAGVYAPDAGELTVNGTVVPLPIKSSEAVSLGLSFVHQEIAMIPGISVAENLFLERTSTSAGGRSISWRSMRAEAKAILSDFGLNFDVDAQVASLGSGERTQLGIARAAHRTRLRSSDDPAFLMLDEPTVFLTQSERAELFDLIRALAASGVAVVLVSHDLTDVMAVTDKVSVLRDGRVVAVRKTSETSKHQLARDIIGTEAGELEQTPSRSATKRPRSEQEPVLKVRRMAGQGVHDVDFDLYPGEILGLTGLVGAGFSTILYMLYGSTKAGRGEVALNGVTSPLHAGSPVKSLSAGMVLIPANRREDAIFASLSASENLALPVLGSCQSFRHVQARALRENFERAVPTYAIRPPIASQPAGEFSGGNQQKIVVAKWLQTKPKVVLIDEPTQGVDVGARQEILRGVRALASEQNTSFIVASSDYEQLAEICDRVILVAHGQIVGTLAGGQVTSEAIATSCLSGFHPAQETTSPDWTPPTRSAMAPSDATVT